MKFLRFAALILMGGPLLLWPYVAAGEAVVADGTPDFAQSEHLANDLRQGMSSVEVQKLLGSPSRTSLKNDGSDAGKRSRGTLQWTYTWRGGSRPASLRVEFAARGQEDWYVNSWDWVNF